jgi:uncharacterized Ntn-hydrolase superfamily protein
MNQKIHLTSFLFLLLTIFQLNSQDTFSIVAVDTLTGEVGCAGASCVDLTAFPGFSDDFLGELFPGIGAINSQAWYNQANQINARNRMNAGDTPAQIIEWLIANDVANQPDLRQYGIVAMVDGSPQSAGHTGASTDDYKNHITGPNYSIQGNILLGEEVLNSMEDHFLNTEGDLACKLMAALQGANMIGADSRCASNGTSSLFAFLKVAEPDDAFGAPSFVVSVRTANGDGIEPIDSLQTIFDATLPCTDVGLNDNENFQSAFEVYPNPANDIITVKNTINGVYQLEVTNTMGSIIYQTSFEEIIEIDASRFGKGVLLIRVYNEKESYVSKFIKN